MKALELKVYEIFKNKLGQQEAETIIEYIDNRADMKYEEKKDTLATKGDIALLKEDIFLVKGDIFLVKEEISLVKQEISLVKQDISLVKKDISQVRKEIAETKVEIIRWCLAFWMGSIASTFAMLKFLFNK